MTDGNIGGNDTLVLTGIAASPGLCIAPAYKIQPLDLNLSAETGHVFEEEIIRLQAAQKEVAERISALRGRAGKKHDAWTVKIFDSHLFLVTDPELIDNVKDRLRKAGVSAEYALLTTREEIVHMLESTGSELIRERAADIRDITDRMIAVLTGQKTADLSDLRREAVIVARDLSPLETSQLDTAVVKGFITEAGGKSSHTAIMARSLGIPAVTGLDGSMDSISNRDIVILDGDEGLIRIRPDSGDILRAQTRMKEREEEKRRLRRYIHEETRTRNGIGINLGSHIGRIEDLEAAVEYGADGIGLFRTEFLFLESNEAPDEEAQFQVYRKVLTRMKPLPVVIRTLDVGGDKSVPCLNTAKEENPSLGLRGIRFCLKNPGVFRTQLRALARASAFGNLKIMFPMIATLEEFEEAKGIFLGVFDEIRKEGIPTADTVEIGVMIEIPSAALIAEDLARVVDFFSIGTNDLIQYCMAADRTNKLVSHLYLPRHPAVLRLIEMVADAARARGIWTGVCGEMAGDMETIPLLLDLGVRELSMSAPLIPKARRLISRLELEE